MGKGAAKGKSHWRVTSFWLQFCFLPFFFPSSHKNLLSTQMMLCQCSRDGKSLKAQPEAKPQARQGVLEDTEEPRAGEWTNLNPNARDAQQKQGMAWLRQPARAALLPLGASLLFCLLTLNWSARPRCTCMDCTAPFQHEIPSWCWDRRTWLLLRLFLQSLVTRWCNPSSQSVKLSLCLTGCTVGRVKVPGASTLHVFIFWRPGSRLVPSCSLCVTQERGIFGHTGTCCCWRTHNWSLGKVLTCCLGPSGDLKKKKKWACFPDNSSEEAVARLDVHSLHIKKMLQK